MLAITKNFDLVLSLGDFSSLSIQAPDFMLFPGSYTS